LLSQKRKKALVSEVYCTGLRNFQLNISKDILATKADLVLALKSFQTSQIAAEKGEKCSDQSRINFSVVHW